MFSNYQISIFSHVKISYFTCENIWIFSLAEILIITGVYIITRGYYMAGQGYEFYLRVQLVSLTRSLRSLVKDTFSTRRKKIVSPSGHVIFCLFYRY